MLEMSNFPWTSRTYIQYIRRRFIHQWKIVVGMSSAWIKCRLREFHIHTIALRVLRPIIRTYSTCAREQSIVVHFAIYFYICASVFFCRKNKSFILYIRIIKTRITHNLMKCMCIRCEYQFLFIYKKGQFFLRN